jgi:hypothetical protein
MKIELSEKKSLRKIVRLSDKEGKLRKKVMEPFSMV